MNPTADYLTWLERDCSYRFVRLLPDGRWSGVSPLMFTAAIIVGKVGNFIGFDDRWCYKDIPSAKDALDAWDGVGEPKGCHRHPATGRRVASDGTEEVFA